MSIDNQNNYFLGASLPLQGLGGGSWLFLRAGSKRDTLRGAI